MAPTREPVGRVTSISDRWFELRNRLLSSPRFQRWAARSVFGRFIARRRAKALFDLCAGFVYSQVLQAVVQLGLLDALRGGPQTVADLAPRLSLPPDAAQRLVDAAASLKLVERRGEGRYGLGIHGAAFIGNPAVTAMVEHHALVYRDLADPVALLRGEQPQTELNRFWSYADRGAPSTERGVAAYSRLMAASLSLIARDILDAYPQRRHRWLLDVGGGDGAFLEAAASETPHLALSLFDLPPVARRAEERFERVGLSSRIHVVGGDVLREPLPKGADLVSLIRVIHDHDDPQALHILKSIRRILPPGGVLLVAEPMAGTRGVEPVGDAYFGFYLLAMGQGRARTEEALRKLLLEAGFDRVRAKRTRQPMMTRLLVAEVARSESGVN
jgi:demethylspheroidene O-methyltransferase